MSASNIKCKKGFTLQIWSLIDAFYNYCNNLNSQMRDKISYLARKTKDYSKSKE